MHTTNILTHTGMDPLSVCCAQNTKERGVNEDHLEDGSNGVGSPHCIVEPLVHIRVILYWMEKMSVFNHFISLIN